MQSWSMLWLMPLLQCQQPLAECRIACLGTARWYALSIGNLFISADSYLPYCPDYLSYPPYDLCRPYCLYYLRHYSLQRAELSEWAHSLTWLHLAYRWAGDDLIRHCSHRGIFVHLEVQKDFPLVVSWDSVKQGEDVLLHTHLGNSHCICVGVCIGTISVHGNCSSLFWAEIVILDFLIDGGCIVGDLSVVLKLHAPKVFPNLKDVELQLWLLWWGLLLPEYLHIINNCVFHLNPWLHAQQNGWSGNTMAIHAVIESGLLSDSHICWWLFQLVIVSFHDTLHLHLLKKWGHPDCPVCIVHAIELGDGHHGRTHLVKRLYTTMVSYCSHCNSTGDNQQPPSEAQQDLG